MKNPKQLMRIVLYNLTVVLLFFSFLEICTATLLRNPTYIPNSLIAEFRRYYNESDREIIQYNPAYAQYDSSLYYIFKQGKFTFSNREFEVNCSINNKGLRDDDASLTHPAIISLGDSYTMGWGVEQDESFPEQLEKITGKKVLNAGVSSYGTARELKLLDQLNTDSLNYIIIQYCTNDMGENKTYLENGNKLVVSDKESYLKTTNEHLENIKYYTFKHLFKMGGILRERLVEGYKPQGIEGMSKEEIEFIYSDHAKTFLKVLSACQTFPDSIPIIVLYLDSYGCNPYFTEAVEREIQSDEFKKLQQRLTTVDFSKTISDNEIYRLDGHLKPAAHKKIADELYRLMQQ